MRTEPIRLSKAEWKRLEAILDAPTPPSKSEPFHSKMATKEDVAKLATILKQSKAASSEL